MRLAAMSGSAERLRIRRAQADEREALEALQRRASLALPDHREQLTANPDAVHLPLEHITGGVVLVAEIGERVAGFAVILPDETKAELDGLFVEQELWRRGIGAALVRAAAHEARRIGLSLTVVANPAAREFYERCGFSEEGEVETRFGPALRMSR
jgi:GNAT superfamily N-acetyltransferase